MATEAEVNSQVPPEPQETEMLSVSEPPRVRVKCATQLYPKSAPLEQEVVFKLCVDYRGRKIELDMTEPSLDVYTLVALKSKITDAFSIKDIKLTYLDDDNDSISVDSQEEFVEALQVGKKLGQLQLTVTGKDYNSYVDQLHQKLSEGPDPEPMELADKAASPANSWINVTLPALTAEVKYPPSLQPFATAKSPSHYLQLAHTVGAEQSPRSSSSYCNPYVERYRAHFGQENSTPNRPNPYVEKLHSKLLSQVGPDFQTGGRNELRESARKSSPPHVHNSYVESLHRALSGTSISKPLEKWQNEYVEALHLALSEQTQTPSHMDCGVVRETSDRYRNDYVERLHAKLSKKRAPCHHERRGEKKRKGMCAGHRRVQDRCVVISGLGEVAGMLAHRTHNGARDTEGQLIHYNVMCDGCDNTIIGARYKCGNCSDYDLCEWCEPGSANIHPSDHVFIKINIPGYRIGVDRKGRPKPLLKRNVYTHQHSRDPNISSDDEQQSSQWQQRSVHPPPQKPRPLAGTNQHTAMSAGYVTRSRDKLREELATSKLRKKEEKSVKKMEAKIEKLQGRLRNVKIDSNKERTEKQRGHGKYLDCQFLTDTSYPDDSVVPFMTPFEKGWLVMNCGTKKWKHVKLVHQDGYPPLTRELAVPELKPGERVELVAEYPPVTDRELPYIQSCWRLVHKESTPFGPVLWLSVAVDKTVIRSQPPVTTLTSSQPPVATLTPSQANENLLKSIGFIPSGESPMNSLTFGATPPTVSDEHLIESYDIVKNPQCGARLTSFDDNCHQSLPQGHDEETVEITSDDSTEYPTDYIVIESTEAGDYEVIVPDCFNLNKPLPGYTPPDIVRKERGCGSKELVIETSSSDDEYEVAPNVIGSEATPTVTPPQPWKTQQVTNITHLLKDDQDPSHWVQSDEDAAQWVQSRDVSHLIPQRWDGPKAPDTPMEMLISMGFGDRVKNQRLLDKHNNDVAMVVEELNEDSDFVLA